MMIVQNDVSGFLTTTTGNPTQYQISKNGSALVGGTGTVALQSLAGLVLTRITPAAGETNTLGRLEYRIMDVGGNTLGVYAFNVVGALPGDTVTDVLGNVAGNIVGNLLGSLAVAERIAIANTSLDLPDSIESGLTLRNTMRCLFAVLAAVSTPNGHQVFFSNFGQTKIRVTCTLGGDGGRPVITYDFS